MFFVSGSFTVLLWEIKINEMIEMILKERIVHVAYKDCKDCLSRIHVSTCTCT